jgi:hypothetical protein
LKEKFHLLKFTAVFAGVIMHCLSDNNVFFLKYEQKSMFCFMGWLFTFLFVTKCGAKIKKKWSLALVDTSTKREMAQYTEMCFL